MQKSYFRLALSSCYALGWHMPAETLTCCVQAESFCCSSLFGKTRPWFQVLSNKMWWC